MKKRLASLVMALALCLTFLPATARADATTYNLWVGGERVTDANASNVLSNGKVSYDPTSTTLTLTDANGVFTLGQTTIGRWWIRPSS